MKDLVASLLEQALSDVAKAEQIDLALLKNAGVEQTRDPSNGDWASNVAMVHSKIFASNPRQLAEKIVAALGDSSAIKSVDIAGPGFINFFTNPSYLAQELNAQYSNGQRQRGQNAAPQTYVVDYSSPNLAKEMHVGHLRSTIIGDAIVRALEFIGHKVIRQNHVGDWGTQFGMLLAYLEKQRAANNGEQALEKLENLEIFYRAAKKEFDDDEAFATRARELVVALQQGDEYCNSLWQEFNAISLKHCQQIYQVLNVTLSLDDVRGESFYNDQLGNIVDTLRELNLLKEDQGAQCVFLPSANDDGEEQAVIIQKKDGGYLYATSDLAAIRYRCKELKADHLYYFVDQRQALHFQQMFKIARLAGFADKQDMQHMGFGTMNNADGKPFKTRDGGTVKLIDLLDEAKLRAAELIAQKDQGQLSSDEQEHIAKVVGIGSVKYADLSKNRSSDYIFNLDNMLSFEGNTAPYLLYAYTRIASLYRNADLDLASYHAEIIVEHDAEQTLCAKLLQFDERIQSMCKKGMPHFLCQYLFELAGDFSSFYEQCPIMKEGTDAATKASRLMLAKACADTLKAGLDILGIETLDKM